MEWLVAHCALPELGSAQCSKDNNKETSSKSTDFKMVPWCLGKSVMRALYDEGFFDDGNIGKMTI